MAKVTTRNGKLVLDFNVYGVRFREQTTLKDNASNRKNLTTVLKKIQADIDSGNLNYRVYFPESKLATKLDKALMLHQFSDGINTPTFEVFAESWFKQIDYSLSPQTVISYRNYYEKRIRPFWGGFEIGSIGRDDIKNFRDQLEKEINYKAGEPIKPLTINRTLYLLKLMLAEAAKQFGFTSPFENIQMLKTSPIILPFSEEEVEMIITKINPNYRAYIIVRFYTGMRSREINALRWRNVDFDLGIIKVRENYSVRSGFTEIKGNDARRNIQMTDYVYQTLHEFDGDRVPDLTVFKTPGTSKPINSENFCNRAWKTVFKKTGISYRSPVNTRHTTVVMWLKSGVPISKVSEQLGSTYPGEILRKYTKFVPSLIKQKELSFASLMHKASQATNRQKEV
jgi:integrase